MKNRVIYFLSSFVTAVVPVVNSVSVAQDTRTEVAGIPINYDESKVPNHTLPDPLILQNGKRVTSAKAWQKKRPKGNTRVV